MESLFFVAVLIVEFLVALFLIRSEIKREQKGKEI